MPPARGLLPNRNFIAVRYYENKKKYIVIIIGFVFFLSSKPEVKNTLFEECDQRRRENLEMKKYEQKKRNRTKPNETQSTLPEEQEQRKTLFQYKELISQPSTSGLGI